MSKFEQTNQLIESLSEVDCLLSLINSEDQFARAALLKSSMVLMVAKFQVFVEGLLSELKFKIRTNLVNFKCTDFLKLNSLRIISEELNLNKKLENRERYNNSFLNEMNVNFITLALHCDEINFKQEIVMFRDKFKLGKTGVGELLELLQQFEGNKNIFSDCEIDIDKFNSLLFVRHNIVHQDTVVNLTEPLITEYKELIISVSNYIDDYLYSFIIE